VDCEEEKADEDPNEKPDMVFLSPSLARFWWVCASEWGVLALLRGVELSLSCN
jgi:hypothetical protein